MISTKIDKLTGVTSASKALLGGNIAFAEHPVGELSLYGNLEMKFPNIEGFRA